MGENPLHRITSLRYRLIIGQVALEPLRILAESFLRVGEWDVSIFALGASHAVRLARGPDVITECLTCAPPSGGDLLLLDESGYSPGAYEADIGEFSCRVTLGTVDLLYGDELSEDFGQERRIDVRYPAAPELPAAATRIGWRSNPGGFTVETIHTYPGEGRGVRSRSHFQVRET